MLLTQPKPVATHLAAEKAKDIDMLALCFASDALVHDEGRDYRGLDAIKSWKRGSGPEVPVCSGACRCFGEP
jgi:hypothetical protein